MKAYNGQVARIFATSKTGYRVTIPSWRFTFIFIDLQLLYLVLLSTTRFLSSYIYIYVYTYVSTDPHINRVFPHGDDRKEGTENDLALVALPECKYAGKKIPARIPHYRRE